MFALPWHLGLEWAQHAGDRAHWNHCESYAPGLWLPLDSQAGGPWVVVTNEGRFCPMPVITTSSSLSDHQGGSPVSLGRNSRLDVAAWSLEAAARPLSQALG